MTNNSDCCNWQIFVNFARIHKIKNNMTKAEIVAQILTAERNRENGGDGL